mgnify:CR=1 FL=1
MYVIGDSNSEEPDHSEVLVVGAGPAGIGVAAALKCAGVQRIKLIDAREIGASFFTKIRNFFYIGNIVRIIIFPENYINFFI